MENVLDVSDAFWQFVLDVNALSYAKLSKTAAFNILADHSPLGGYALTQSVLGLTGETASQLHITDPRDGVYHDEANKRFVFSDVTSLLRNTLHLVLDSSMKRLLEACLHKVCSFVDVSDLAEGLQGQSFSQ